MNIHIGHQALSCNLTDFSAVQFLVCSALSFIGVLFFDRDAVRYFWRIGADSLWRYRVCRTGYTLQVFGQRYASLSHSAVLLNTESVFTSLSSFLLLGEQMGARAVADGVFIFFGKITAQRTVPARFGTADETPCVDYILGYHFFTLRPVRYRVHLPGTIENGDVCEPAWTY
ncbi:MAG: EamA family transporter [Spirochaetota bacterium]